MRPRIDLRRLSIIGILIIYHTTLILAHEVILSWVASPSAGVAGYRVLRSSRSGGPYSSITSTLVAGTAYTDTNVTAGSTYYYVTAAVDGQGDASTFSNEAAATIPNVTDTPIITEVDNGFSNVPNSPIAAANWVVIKGANLSTTSSGRGWNANENFPTSMDGTSVTINKKAAYLYYVSPTQVNVQAPTDAIIGPVNVVVTNNGAMSASATAELQPYSPALMQWGGGQFSYAEITRYPDNAFVGNPAVITGTVAAKAGDILILWATGLGTTNPAVPAGQQPAPVNGHFPIPITNPVVTVGGNPVTVLGANLRYAGLYQVNIQLPASLPKGDLPIKVLDDSYQSPDGIYLNVQ